MNPRLSATTTLCGVFGDPVKHSISPALHNKGFEKADLDYAYLAFTADEGTIGQSMDAVRTLGMRGASITAPNKIAVMQYLDEVDPTAQAIGAVNTVVNRDGYLTGYNTDGFGFLQGFANMGVEIKGGKMVLLGLGGAGGSVAYTAAMDCGLAELVVFNRAGGKSWGHAEEVVARINEQTGCKARLCDLNDKELLKAEMATAQMLANTTTVGMGAQEGMSPVPDSSYFPAGMAVQDAIYRPAETELLRLAREAGCKTSNGLTMLFYQGARAFEYWTGQQMPLTVDDLEIAG